MKIEDFTQELADKIGAGRFVVSRTGHPDWHRVFVQRKDGVQIGRISFYEGRVYTSKWYKSKLSGDMPIDESDEIQCRLAVWRNTGHVLTHEKFWALAGLANFTAEAAFNKNKLNRKLLQEKDIKERGRIKRRRKLVRPDRRQFLRELIMLEISHLKK